MNDHHKIILSRSKFKQSTSFDKFYLYISLAASFLVLIFANITDSETAKTISNFYFITLSITVVIFSIMLFKKHGFETRDGKLLLFFTLFAVSRTCAEILWIIYESIIGTDPFPSYADVFWFISYGMLYAFLTFYLKPVKKSIPKNTHILAISLAVSFLIPSTVMTYLLFGQASQFELVLGLTYPILDALVLYPTILGLMLLYNGKKNDFLFFLLMAILSIMISDTFFLTLGEQYQNGNLIDLGWIAGYILLSFAALSFRTLTKDSAYQSYTYIENKKIINSLKFGTVVRFVIPFVVVAISTITIMIVINDQYFDRIYQIKDDFTYDIYIVIGALTTVSFVVLFINRKLFHLVKSRTYELEIERDALQLQIKEKNLALQKSSLLEKENMRTLQILSDSEQKYRNLYDGSNDMYYTINTKGIILDCNKSFSSNLGYEKDELIGKIIFDYLAERSIYDMNMTFATWIDTGHTVDREIWLKRKDSSIFPTLLSISNLYDKSGNLVGGNTTMKDITVQKNMSDQLSKTLSELQNIDRMKDEFLAMVSHELKTPLVPIIGYCDILMSEKLGSLNMNQKKRIAIILECSFKLKRLISDILDVQKLELKQLKLQKEHHDLGDIIRGTLEDFLPLAAEKQITIRMNQDRNIQCFCDKYRIQQVLGNLIKNSLEFCSKNSGKIIIHVVDHNDVAEIIVEDNGKGIPEEKLEKLFVKFYQIDTSTRREHGGTGLGLSICKGIVESHDGKIWAESKLERGTKIHILLPLNGKKVSTTHNNKYVVKQPASSQLESVIIS